MDSVFIPGMQILPWEDIEFLVVDICKGILEGESGDTICPGVIRLQGKEVSKIHLLQGSSYYNTHFFQ